MSDAVSVDRPVSSFAVWGWVYVPFRLDETTGIDLALVDWPYP